MTRGANALIRRLLKLDHTSVSVESLAQIFLEAACDILPIARAALFSYEPSSGTLGTLRAVGFSVDGRNFKELAGELPLSHDTAPQSVPSGFDVRLRAFMGTEAVMWRFDRLSGLALAIGDDRGPLGQLDLGSVEIALDVFANIVERKRAEQRLLYDAFHDALTGLPNRTLLIEHLDQAMGRAQRANGYLFSILFIDIDRFKVVNDSLGHGAGDELLVAFGERLQRAVRGGDVVARLGGDEFAVLADDLTELGDALRLADRIQEQLTQPFELGTQKVFVSASIGIARNAARYRIGTELLRDADIAMYRAKEFGGGQHRLFDSDMRTAMVSRLHLETELRESIDAGHLELVYQPIVDLRSGRLRGFEALLRWNHPRQGTVMPGEFIGVAEETGLIVPIGRWLLERTCAVLEKLNRGRAELVSISINLTDREFLQHDLVGAVQAALAGFKVPEGCLHIELTEGMLLQHGRAEADTLPQLKALGVKLSIDDFGTGYSSLSRLQKLPIDSLKIDHSFVMDMGKDGGSSEIVRSIIGLAHNLDIAVIAEGVERPEQLYMLQELACEFVQGFLLSKPIPESELEAAADRRDWLTASAS